MHPQERRCVLRNDDLLLGECVLAFFGLSDTGLILRKVKEPLKSAVSAGDPLK